MHFKFEQFKFVLTLKYMPFDFALNFKHMTYATSIFFFKQTDYRENVLSWKESDKSGLQFRSLNISGACDCSHH